jgi:uncharacterized protein (TIGR02996 family)
MPRYEFKEGSSSKFWEITLSGSSFTTRWGKIGTSGQEKKQSFSNAMEAKQEYDKLIASKVKKGYEIVEGTEDAEEEGEEGSGAAKAASNPELEAAILKAPDNAEAYLVYADWLQAQGDPRGELIALQHAALQASGDEATSLKRKASALIRKYRGFLLGDLAEALENEELKVSWHLGFLQSARLGKKDYDSDFDVEEGVKKLLALPSARFLRELTIGMVSFDGDNSYDDVVTAIAKGGGWPTLESLFLGDFEYPDENEISWTNVGDIEPLYKVLPRLRSLKLRGGSEELGKIHLPELREFTVESGGLPLEAVRSIASAHWPRLERLEVWFGMENYGAGGGVEDIQPILDGKGLPNLKYLGLKNFEFGSELCEALPQAKILAQLETLDLSKGTITDEDAEVLAANAAAFKHLKRLDLTENLLTDEGARRLAKLCPDVARGNQRADDYDDDEDSRYPAVGE